MRLCAALLLLISFSIPTMARKDAPLDKLASGAIDQICAVIARDNHLTADQETDLYIGLSTQAHNDQKTENALVFAECGNRVLKAGQNSGVLDILDRPQGGAVWNDLQAMARKYQSDGVPPIVNYKALTTPDGPDKLSDAHITQINIGDQCTDEDNLFKAYEQARHLGLTPQEAYAKVVATDGATTKVVLGKIENSLCCTGKVTLTGYDMASAHKDLPDYLESHFAFSCSDAPDIKAVTPARDPFDFMSYKVEQGIQLDLRRVMKPVNSYVDKFLDGVKPANTRPIAPPVDNTPNFNDLNRTPNPDSGSGMPTWDQMKLPASASVDGEGWKLQTWWALKDCTRKDMELKCQRIAYGVDVFKIRQTSDDHNNVRVISAPTHISIVDGSGDLLSNKTYVAVFNVWYWGENGTKAYFGDGSAGNVEPPAGMRAYLTASSGKTFIVKVRFRTDAQGIGRIALFARGRCALELGEFYNVHVVEAGVTEKK